MLDFKNLIRIRKGSKTEPVASFTWEFVITFSIKSFVGPFFPPHNTLFVLQTNILL